MANASVKRQKHVTWWGTLTDTHMQWCSRSGSSCGSRLSWLNPRVQTDPRRSSEETETHRETETRQRPAETTSVQLHICFSPVSRGEALGWSVKAAGTHTIIPLEPVHPSHAGETDASHLRIKTPSWRARIPAVQKKQNSHCDILPCFPIKRSNHS